MAVSTIHPLYRAMLETWQRNADAVDGERAVKRRNTRYLPIPNAEETHSPDDPRYQSYITRAVYTNFTGRTVKGLVGAVFRQEPSVELPNDIEYLNDSADRAGLSLATIAQRAVSEVLTKGRYIVLADYPEAPTNATAEDTAGLQAYLACYPAEALINWHETNGVTDLLVLREWREERVNDFDYDVIEYHRVLRLREGVATIQLYREETPHSEEVEIRGFDGMAFDEIPAVVIGSEDNNLDPDVAPISDIAALNIAHYRNSADYEEGVFLHGQPMLSINTGEDSSEKWVEVNPGFQVGSRTAVVTKGGGMDLVQAQANSAAMEAMSHKESQMVRLGAQIISDARGQETAEAARIRSGAETSTLNTVVRNVSTAFEQALQWCLGYMSNSTDEVQFELNMQFFERDADPQVMAQLIMGVDRGLIPGSVYQDYARKSGLVDGDMANEELDAYAVNSSPLLG